MGTRGTRDTVDRRSFIGGLLGLAAAGVARSPRDAAAAASLKVGVVGVGAFAPVTVGAALGLFAKDGVAVEVIEHRGGAEAAQAMVGGGLDLFEGDFSHALRLNQQGQQIRVICGTTDRHAYTLIGAPGAKPGVASLKGQKVGITSPGSQTDNSMRWLLVSSGLAPDRDVELVAVGGGTTMMAAIQNRQVYAGMLVQPLTAQLRTQGFVTVYDFTEEVGPFQGTVFMARQAWLQEHGDAVRQFLRAYLRIVGLLHDDPGLRQEAVRKIFPRLDPKVADVAVAALVRAYPRDGKVGEAAVKRVFEFDRVARGLERPVPPLSTFADFSYLPS